MRIAYALLAVVLFAASTLLGAFYLGHAGLSVPPTSMSVAWISWFAGVALAGVLLVLAVWRLNLALVLALSALPFALGAAAFNLIT